MTLPETCDATDLLPSAVGAQVKPVSPSVELWCGVALVVSAVLFLAGEPVDAPTCSLNAGALVLGMEDHVGLAVGADASCAFTLRIAATAIESSEIVTPARHGTAALAARSLVRYRPSPAFHGEDSFDLAIRGRSPVHDGLAVIRIDVTVE